MNKAINQTNYNPQFTRKILRACHTAMNNANKVALVRNKKGKPVLMVYYDTGIAKFYIKDATGETIRYSMGKALIMNTPLNEFKQGMASFIQLRIAG